MKKEEIQEYKGKKIKVVLKSQYIYRGFIVSVGDDSFRFKDAFGNIIIISFDQVGVILPIVEEVGGG